jgi:hypothetical protein
MRLIHPYTDLNGGQWLRGNLHTHTTRTDGTRPPQEVIDDYAARGYRFLMISDHDLYTGPQEYAAWDARGMILISGNEVTARGPHLLHVDADRRIEPDADRQVVLNDIARSGRGFAIINHPNWQATFNHCSIEQLSAWSGYAGMEIYNATIGRLDGSPYATNKWDILLSQGRRVWGFANDDSHQPQIDVAQGWTMAYVREPSAANIVSALLAGRFYASTGVTINAIAVEGRRIRIETENARRITALMQVGRRFEQTDGRSIEVEVPDGAKYVRFECWGDGERFAWTQPFFIEAQQ